MSLESSEVSSDHQLTDTAVRVLKRENVLNAIGYEIKKDLRENPWKLSPLFVPFPTGGLCYAAVGTLVFGTLILKNITDPNFRQSISDARNLDVMPQLYEAHLVQCENSGEVNVDQKSLSKHRLGKIKAHTHHLVGLQVDKIPKKLGQDVIRTVHHKFAGIKLPSNIEEANDDVGHFDPSYIKQETGRTLKWMGPVFAMACLSSMDPSAITQELFGRDRELYLEDIEKDQTSLTFE